MPDVKRPQVFVYRRSSNAYLSWIGDVATKRDFYSSPMTDGSVTLDDEITSYENRLGPMLARLRGIESGLIDDRAGPAELVAHLCARAAFMRNFFDAALQELTLNVGTLLSDRDVVRAYLRMDESDGGPWLSEEIDKAINGIGVVSKDAGVRALLKRLLVFGFREEFDGFHSTQMGQLNTAIADFRKGLPAAIRQAHARTLLETKAPEERLEGLAKLRWWKVHSSTSLILPDCIAVSSDSSLETGFAPYMTHSNDALEYVLVPIDSRQMLIGCRNQSNPEDRHVDNFNRIAVRCSIDFFLSQVRDKRMDDLAATLGAVPERAVEEAVREGLADFSKPLSSDVKSPSVAKDLASSDSYSYDVSFIGCVNLHAGQMIANAVKLVVDSVSGPQPLRFLAQVIFAADYERVLTELDRGFEVGKGLTTTTVSYGTGVAMAPLVVREGKVKCVLVARAWIGIALLEDETPDFFAALHTLICMVARVKYMSIVNNAFPEFLIKPIADPWDAFFIRHVESVSSAYFGARAASHIGSDFGSGYIALFRDSLAMAAKHIPTQRLAYRTSANLDSFLQTALPALGDVLIHAASALGHFDGIGNDPLLASTDEDLGRLLRSLSLTKWIDTYRIDLQRIYDFRGEWESSRELLAVSIHLERLLWAFGVFPWRTTDGMIRVEIPTESDATFLTAHSPL